MVYFKSIINLISLRLTFKHELQRNTSLIFSEITLPRALCLPAKKNVFNKQFHK